MLAEMPPVRPADLLPCIYCTIEWLEPMEAAIYSYIYNCYCCYC